MELKINFRNKIKKSMFFPLVIFSLKNKLKRQRPICFFTPVSFPLLWFSKKILFNYFRQME